MQHIPTRYSALEWLVMLRAVAPKEVRVCVCVCVCLALSLDLSLDLSLSTSLSAFARLDAKVAPLENVWFACCL